MRENDFPLNNPKILFRVHAVQRMFERDISIKKLLGAIKTGGIIEDYSSEAPEPCRLILGFQGDLYRHVGNGCIEFEDYKVMKICLRIIEQAL